MVIKQVDLNCDMGEGMIWDPDVMPYISSVNIACGGHAGDEDTMRRTVALALAHETAIGAHPSFPDRENFGRTDLLDNGFQMDLLTGIIRDQLQVLQKICEESGTKMHHVKPHGALYNRAARDAKLASLICRTIHSFDPSLILYGLSGSEMKTAAEAMGLAFVNEVFADRSYSDNGLLTPRTEAGAIIHDPGKAAAQALRMVREGSVLSLTGNPIGLQADTICIHGDMDQAPSFARTISHLLLESGILVRAF